MYADGIILFTTSILGKPLVRISNKSTLRELYKVGNIYGVECYVAGYPLPDVKWAFKRCQNDSECQKSNYTQTPVKFFNMIFYYNKCNDN